MEGNGMAKVEINKRLERRQTVRERVRKLKLIFAKFFASRLESDSESVPLERPREKEREGGNASASTINQTPKYLHTIICCVAFLAVDIVLHTHTR